MARFLAVLQSTMMWRCSVYLSHTKEVTLAVDNQTEGILACTPMEGILAFTQFGGILRLILMQVSCGILKINKELPAKH